MLIAEKETIIHDADAANLIALHVGVVENVRIKRLCRNHIFYPTARISAIVKIRTPSIHLKF